MDKVHFGQSIPPLFIRILKPSALEDAKSHWSRLRQWSIFRAMRCRWFTFQQRCDTDYFLERLNITIVLRLFFLTIGNDYFLIILLILRTDYFAIIHDLPPNFHPKELLMSSFIRINLSFPQKRFCKNVIYSQDLGDLILGLKILSPGNFVDLLVL